MKNSGFSLIELLVVVALLGIMLGIAGISAKSMRDKYRVEAQMKEMLVDLLNARVSAMSKNRMHFVTFSSTQYAIYEDTNPSPNGDGDLQTGSDTRIVQKNLNADYAISRTGASQVDFDTRGLVVAGTQTIWVTAPFGAASDCIEIAVTRILIGASNGTSDCIAQ